MFLEKLLASNLQHLKHQRVYEKMRKKPQDTHTYTHAVFHDSLDSSCGLQEATHNF